MFGKLETEVARFVHVHVTVNDLCLIWGHCKWLMLGALQVVDVGCIASG